MNQVSLLTNLESLLDVSAKRVCSSLSIRTCVVALSLFQLLLQIEILELELAERVSMDEQVLPQVSFLENLVQFH